LRWRVREGLEHSERERRTNADHVTRQRSLSALNAYVGEDEWGREPWTSVTHDSRRTISLAAFESFAGINGQERGRAHVPAEWLLLLNIDRQHRPVDALKIGDISKLDQDPSAAAGYVNLHSRTKPISE
jgi:hypothetical protein